MGPAQLAFLKEAGSAPLQRETTHYFLLSTKENPNKTETRGGPIFEAPSWPETGGGLIFEAPFLTCTVNIHGSEKARAALSVRSPGDRVESRWRSPPSISVQQKPVGDLSSYRKIGDNTQKTPNILPFEGVSQRAAIISHVPLSTAHVQ